MTHFESFSVQNWKYAKRLEDSANELGLPFRNCITESHYLIQKIKGKFPPLRKTRESEDQSATSEAAGRVVCSLTRYAVKPAAKAP